MRINPACKKRLVGRTRYVRVTGEGYPDRNVCVCGGGGAISFRKATGIPSFNKFSIVSVAPISH